MARRTEPYKLYNAALFGRIAELERLLINWDETCWSKEGSFSALHAAASKGYASCVDLLIAAGAPLDRRDIAGETPLHAAAYGRTLRHTACVSRLLDAGADPLIRDLKGRMPLGLARSRASEEALELASQPKPPKKYIVIAQPDGDGLAFIELADDDDLPPEEPVEAHTAAQKNESERSSSERSSWNDAIDAFTGVTSRSSNPRRRQARWWPSYMGAGPA